MVDSKETASFRHNRTDTHTYVLTKTVAAHTGYAQVQIRQNPSTEGHIEKKSHLKPRSYLKLKPDRKVKINFLQWSITQYIYYTPE